MRRIEEEMPLNIPRYLADTADLDNAASGAYLHALMHQWQRGSLPDDMEECAVIMKIRGMAAPEIALAILQKFFTRVEDGLGNATWIQKRGALIKAVVTARAIKYSQRAVKANSIRWAGHVAKYPPRSPSWIPSRTPQGILGLSLLESQSTEVQKQEETLSSLRSLGSQPQAAGPILTEKHIENGSRPNGQVKGSPAHPKTPQDAPQAPRTAKSVTQGKKTAATRQSSRNTTAKNGAETAEKPKRTVDPRFLPFRGEVMSYWSDQNPGVGKYGWDVEDGRALNNLLRRYKTLDFALFCSCLRNRAQSKVNPAESPARWLGRLMEFSSGPLNEYLRPIRR